MNFVSIEYTGRKPYRDRTAIRNVWTPGDVRLVAERDSKTLLKFAEFNLAEKKPGADDAKAAMMAHAAVEQEAVNEEQTRIDTLALIESMDKDGLKQYAAKYPDAEIDFRKSVKAIRLELGNIIDLHGVR